MRFNDKEIIALGQKKEGELSGRLSYAQFKGPDSSYKNAGFRDRFFKLVGNLLFYFRFNDLGTVDFREPVGVIVLENFKVQPFNAYGNFAFGVIFMDEPDKRHIFTARTDPDAQIWINTLQTASYQHWSNLLKTKRSLMKALLDSRQPSVTAPISQAEIHSTQSHASSIPREGPLISFSDESANSNVVSNPPSHSFPGPTSSSRKMTKEEDLIRF